MKRFHSHNNGTAWTEDRRWFELVMNDRPYIEKLEGSFRFASFNDWWLTHGSGMPLLVNEDDAEHTERMCRMAWYAGFSKGGRK